MKPATVISAAIFALVALLHVARFAFGWEVRVGGLTIPMWVSPIGLVVAGTLAFLLWRDARR